MILDILLFTTLLICLITDLRSRKIYNKVLLPALMIGLAVNVYSNGLIGLLNSIQGFFLGLAFLLVPFMLGGIGAGDVKLLALIGALKGPQFVFTAFIGMGIAGGILAILVLLYQGRLFKTLRELAQSIILMVATDFKMISLGTDNKQNFFPYGVAISLGALAAYIVG